MSIHLKHYQQRRGDDMNVKETYGKNTMSKLTITKDGEVRIKYAKGMSQENIEVLRRRLLVVAGKVIEKKYCHTRRGVVGDIGIMMSNDAKTQHDEYYWKELE